MASVLAVLGPGLLAGLSDDDTAGITMHSRLGTEHGDRLLWIIPASTVLLVQFHPVARVSVVALPELPLIPLIYGSQVVNTVVLPAHIIALLLLAVNAEIMKDACSSPLSRMLGGISIALVLACLGGMAWSWIG